MKSTIKRVSTLCAVAGLLSIGLVGVGATGNGTASAATTYIHYRHFSGFCTFYGEYQTGEVYQKQVCSPRCGPWRTYECVPND
jgi:hypothetical protein